jgi:hypothetical protein
MKKVKLLYVQKEDRHEDDPGKWGTFQGEITKEEQLLLELQLLGKPWVCNFDHGPNSKITLLSFFANKYPPKAWWHGDPMAVPRLDKIDGHYLGELQLFFFHAAGRTIIQEYDYSLRAKSFVDARKDKADEFTDYSFEYIDYLTETLQKNSETLSIPLHDMVRNISDILRLKSEQCSPRDSSPKRK